MANRQGFASAQSLQAVRNSNIKQSLSELNIKERYFTVEIDCGFYPLTRIVKVSDDSCTVKLKNGDKKDVQYYQILF